jgi:preprotein translocase subunit SecA
MVATAGNGVNLDPPPPRSYILCVISKLMNALAGSKHQSDLKMLVPVVREINDKEPWAMGLSSEDFLRETERLMEAVAGGSTLDTILPEAYALAREAARRVLGERLYDVQLMGGIVLHQGKIMEMKTGEGKTLSSVTAAYLNALKGEGVHIVTVNDYLAERDANWMGPVFRYLGLTVGAIVSNMDTENRKEAYSRDITYGTNNEFGFDYLRDNMRLDLSLKTQRGHHFCIIDEIDSILIDEARTPLIISGAAQDDVRKYAEVNRVVGGLIECTKDPETDDYPEFPEGDYKIDEKSKRVTFTDEGLNHMEEVLQAKKIISGSLFDEENFEYIHHVTQALRAHRLFHRDTQYVVKEGQVQIVDEFTGRILYGRRYSDGLHQAIEAKEGIRPAERNRTLATITFQNFFRMYDKVSGMTGTAATEAKEFGKIYGLDVVVVPTNRPVVRADEDDLIYLSEDDKYRAICDEIADAQKKGQPTLVGTVSIERSEKLSKLLTGRGVPHEVLNAKNHAREALIIAEAGAKGSVTIATNMAGRGTDIKLGGNPEYRARRRVGTDASQEDYLAAVSEEIEKWRKQYEEVQSLGGLYVLGTERHESRRIDNQLRGRSGRQGDPGLSRFFLSMDDDLMRLFGRGSINLKSLMAKGLPEGEPLNHSLINRSIEKAQSRVEERNFEIRKHLLEFDDVLNEQRKVIYKQRDDILQDTNVLHRVLRTAEDVLDEAMDEVSPGSQAGGATVAFLLDTLRERILFSPSVDPAELEPLSAAALRERLWELIQEDLNEKQEVAGNSRLNLSLRYEYIRNIDSKWQDHLENLEALREAVYLRSYAQKNPLLEYKLEGFQIFDQLLHDIRVAVARKLFAVRAEGFRESQQYTAPVAGAVARHRQIQVFGGGATSGAQQRPSGGAPTAVLSPTQGQGAASGAAAGGQQAATVRRNIPKVGRNDPCPCGSGKKYKHCHGR